MKMLKLTTALSLWTLLFQCQCFIYAQECGSRLTTSGGIIESPEYEYQGTGEDLECTWFIEAGEGQRVRLTFLEIWIEDAEDGQCDSARLQIHDGPDIYAPSLGNVLCTESSAQEVTSHTSSLTVYFKAGEWSFYQFKIEYSFYDAEDNEKYCVQNMCNATIVDQPSCNIQSPSYPHGYDANLDCKWYLQSTKKRERITLMFDDLKLKYDKRKGRCNGHHVTIYDGHDITKKLHGPICHYELDNMEGMILQSTGNKMLIVMTSDGEAGGQDDDTHNRGFSAQITMKPRNPPPPEPTKPKLTTVKTKTTTTTTEAASTTTIAATTTTVATRRTKKPRKNKPQKTVTTTTTTIAPTTTTKAPTTTTTKTTTPVAAPEPTSTTTSVSAKLTSAVKSTNRETSETVELNQAGPSGFLKYGHYVIAAVVGSCVIALTCFAIYRMRKRRYSGHDLVSTEKI